MFLVQLFFVENLLNVFPTLLFLLLLFIIISVTVIIICVSAANVICKDID
jgi:hypothetical protein